MARLDHTKSSYSSREAIPTDVLETYRRTYGLRGWEERLRLPAHLSKPAVSFLAAASAALSWGLRSSAGFRPDAPN